MGCRVEDLDSGQFSFGEIPGGAVLLRFTRRTDSGKFWQPCTHKRCPNTIEGKKDFLHRNHIALWDVIESCDIIGSADSSIKNAVPADIASLLQKAPVSRIFVNGSLAKKLYDRYSLSPNRVRSRQTARLPARLTPDSVWRN